MSTNAHVCASVFLLGLSLPAAAGAAKVDICHHNGSDEVLTLSVSPTAALAHLANHGDTYPGTWYTDADGDGYGDSAETVLACLAPDGTVGVGGDVDDSDPTVYPGALDVCDTVDNDSDGDTDEDALSGATLLTRVGTSLLMIAPGTGESAEVSDLSASTLGVEGINALTSDLLTGETYGLEKVTDQLVRVDVCSGAVTPIGPLGYSNTCGLSFGPGGALYGIDSAADALLRVDPATGAATSIGGLGFNLRNCGLAYDCSTDELYGVHINPTGEDWIFSINATTGLATREVTLDPSVPWAQAGLEVDVPGGVYYVSMATGLYAVDAATGAATLRMSAADVDNLSWWAGNCE